VQKHACSIRLTRGQAPIPDGRVAIVDNAASLRQTTIPIGRNIGMQNSNKALCRSAMAAILAMSMASAVSAGVALNAPADIAAIGGIEQKLATLNTMKDLIRYYAPDAVVFDMYAPGVYRGTKQIYDGFEQQFAQGQSFTGTIRDMNILSDGNFGCAATQQHFDFVMKNGTKGAITLRQLDAYKKIGGNWLIVQQHISFPMDPKTGMGLLDSPMPVRGPLKYDPHSFASPPVPVQKAKEGIRAWLDTGAQSRDLDELMTYYGPTDDVIVYDMLYPPGEFRGMKEIRDGFAPVMDFTNQHSSILDFVVDSDGVFAVQIDTQEITIARKDGTNSTFYLRQNDCMRRVKGKWYAVFEEISEPVDAKTGKSVTQASAIASN
jgi:ketosteroid isomerase-like protein